MPTVEPQTKLTAKALGNTCEIASRSPIPGRMTHFRWVILFLVFFGSTINYVDRLVMGILAPDLQKLYSISDVQYGYIQSAFAFTYAIGQLISGGLLDWFGMRIGYAVSLS